MPHIYSFRICDSHFFRCDWPRSNSDTQSFYDSIRTKIAYPNQSPNCMPIINRGLESTISPYLTTSDDRLIEYGFSKVIFDQCSSYQRVQIVKTMDHGNVLILDGAVNLAENDTEAYTHSLMNLPNVSNSIRCRLYEV